MHDTHGLRKRESRRETSSDVSSTIPSGRVGSGRLASGTHSLRKRESRRKTSSDVSSTASIGALEGTGAVQRMHDTYPLRRRESRREAMSVERFHRALELPNVASALTVPAVFW